MVMNLPRLVTDLLTPKIIWYQTDLTVVIRIMLADVKDYYLKVESNLLLFSTILQGKGYYVCLYLFGTVVAEETTHRNLGREIKIYLTKAFKWGKWLRLHIENVRNPSIVSDPDHLYQVDWSTEPFIAGVSEWEDFEEYKRKNNITNIMPDVPSTDEEESEDEMFDSWFMK